MFYQNREQEAYQTMNEILPEMNRVLQSMARLSEDKEEAVAFVLKEFVEAFQRKDALGLADLLGYAIPDVMAMIIEKE